MLRWLLSNQLHNLESNPTDSVWMTISDSSTNSGGAEMEIRGDLVHKVFRILSLYRSIRDRLPIMKKNEILLQMAEEHTPSSTWG